jgi:hypothetical protein
VKETAILLADPGWPVNDRNVTNLLQFFGLASRISTIQEFVAGDHAIDECRRTIRILCSSDTFWKLLDECDRTPSAIRLWREQVHSAFVYGGNNSSLLQKLASRLMGDEHTPIIQIDDGLREWIVSDKFPQFCGVMTGIRIPVGKTAAGAKVHSKTLGPHSALFVDADYQSVPVFLSGCSEIIDINSELADRNFDIRNHLPSALPIVMYVKWTFGEASWASPETNACVVLDDPLLRPKYGFLNYQNLLGLMEDYDFTTSIAFIPWNWRRSGVTVTDIFKIYPERYSLSIHGCDHTGAEFGSQNVDGLVWKSRQAIDRMSRHEKRTGIPYDPIMVFPQGVFSAASMAVLKRAQYMAAVNTEVLSADLPRPSVTISDVWDVAVMRYANFPIFTRRYPSQGVENFAFDILLGKPCIVVVHHDYCRDNCARLVDLIERLNALNYRLSWRSLGEVVRRSCRQRELSSDTVEVEMYGSKLRLENRSERRRRYLVSKRESDASGVKAVRTESQEIPWNFLNGRIHFQVELAAGQSTMVGITFHDYPTEVCYRENTGYKLKVMLRRYLSEVRDRYVITRRRSR